jgi:hypothetical protein
MPVAASAAFAAPATGRAATHTAKRLRAPDGLAQPPPQQLPQQQLDKCDTLIDILKEIKSKREDMDAIIDVKKMI